VNTHKISEAGRLLVQAKLAKAGVSCKPALRNAAGAHFIVGPEQITLRVATNLQPKPGGGKGSPVLEWWIDDSVQASYTALVDLSTDRVWLLETAVLRALAQQHSSGRSHIYMNVDPTVVTTTGKESHDTGFDAYLIERCIDRLAN